MNARGPILRHRQTLDRAGRFILSAVLIISFIACEGAAATTAYASPAGRTST